MEWQDWLDKKTAKTINDDFPKGKPPHIDYNKTPDKTIPRTRSDFDDETHEDPYVNNSISSVDSWESWLEKNDPCWEGYEQYGMKDKDGKKVPNCIKKNNAIETSHKEGEKKEEWNGKFDNSTTRDDAENDDDKAIGKEESLEELTDGKLEEVEKLKAWEIFLDKTNNATLNYRHYKPRHDKNDKKILDNHGTNYDESTFHGQPIEASEENRNEGTGKLDQDKRNWNTTEGERGGSKKTPTGQNISHDGSEYNESTGDYSATQFGTDRILARFKEEDRVGKLKPKKPSSPNAVNPKQPHSKDDYALHDTEDVGTKITAGMESLKSWESWLTKYEETVEDKKLALDLNEARAVRGKKIASQKVKPETGEDAKMGEYSTITAEKFKSWEGWLDKMQGAGDARFGNQHLTGMEQKPVADDESIELSAESEENNEKQEKTEDKEDKDNKPYKALSQE